MTKSMFAKVPDMGTQHASMGSATYPIVTISSGGERAYVKITWGPAKPFGKILSNL